MNNLQPNNSLTVYIMCRNRIEFACETIQSVLNQTYKEFNFIISDNSTNNKLKEFIDKNFPNIKYIKRPKSLSPVEHQNIILQENSSEYFVIFHDDDVMSNKYLEKMMEYIRTNDYFSALAPNANIIWGNKETSQLFADGLNKWIYHKNPKSIFKHYMHYDYRYHAPFPGYLYNSKYIKDIRFSWYEGGRYNDIAFLMKLTDRAPVIWSPDVLLKYRDHPLAGRYKTDFYGKFALARFALNNSSILKNSDEIIHFKLITHIKYLKNKISYLLFKRKRRVVILLKFIFINILKKPIYIIKLVKIIFKKRSR